MASRRGLFAGLAAAAALAGLAPTRANATADVTVNTGSTAQVGILASTGTSGTPILPNIGTTTHSVIGSQSSLATATLDSGVFGARSGAGRAGVLGVNAGAGPGVAGYSLSGVAVYGETDTTTAVSGVSASGVAISGVSTDGVAISGKSTSKTAIQGTSESAVAVRGISNTNYGIRGDSTKQSGVIAGTSAPGVAALTARSSAPTRPTAGRFVGAVRVEGDFAVTGVKAAAVPMPDGSLATMYCQEAPEPFFEDFGRARLEKGAARVAVDPAFASLVRQDNLMVFLTPEGDSRGLYVHARDTGGFEVRESQGGTSTLDFSWRLVGKRRDITGDRLAPLDPMPEIEVSEADDVVDVRTEIAMALKRDPSHREV